MEADWENVEFDVSPYKSTGTYMLKASDETSQQLDDHIVMTQAMAFSPFKKEFEERINQWELTLKLTQVSDISSKQSLDFFFFCGSPSSNFSPFTCAVLS